MDLLIRSNPTSGLSSTVGASSKTSPQKQSEIKAGIGRLGDFLRGLPMDANFDNDVKPAIEQWIKVINHAPDQQRTSDLFGGGTTNKEENLYLLMTAVDSANLSKNQQGILLAILNKELARGRGTDSYFGKVQEIEKKITAPVTDSLLSLSNRTSSLPWRTNTISIGDQEFNIEHTTGAGKSDCLAYALQSDNVPLADNYRAVLFTSKNIENQLNRLIAAHNNLNVLNNSYDDSTTDLDVAKIQVLAGYQTRNGIQIPKDTDSIPKLSQVLATHIQKSGCLLDAAIAGGIFADIYKQPIVIARKDNKNELVFNVLSSKGELIYQGRDLDKVGISLHNAKYIFNHADNHFERMVPVAR
jgi:hypothetical protein